MKAARRKWLNAFLGLVLLLVFYKLNSGTRGATNRTLPEAPVQPYLPHNSHGQLDKPARLSQLPSNAPTGVQQNGPYFHYPIASYIPLPIGPASALPQIQYDFQPEHNFDRVERERRLDAVKEAFVHSWQGYKKHAWLYDEVAPISGGYRTTFGGWAASLVDSLDTLWIMGMVPEFEEAVKAASRINFNETENLPLNVFETTIRYLGGFLGAYDVSDGKYPVLLQKATEVGEMLYGAFDTPNRMPIIRWQKTGVEVASGNSVVAELGSLSMEFTRLSQLTGDPKFYDAVQRITDEFDKQQNETRLPGMWPIRVNAREVSFREDNTFALGSLSDSMYEYLLKEHVLLGGLTAQYSRMYKTAMKTIKQHILFRPMTPEGHDILFTGGAHVITSTDINLDPRVEHLSCFVGGMVGIGAKIFNDPSDLEIAKKLVHGCVWAYELMPTGMMPEVFHALPCPAPYRMSGVHCAWNDNVWGLAIQSRNSQTETTLDAKLPFASRVAKKAVQLRLPKGISAIGDRAYKLRPEAIESLFILYRSTGDPNLSEKAWMMFENIVSETRTEVAFAGIDDVTWKPSPKTDRMESFWMAETLKYFYLMFSEPDVISLDEYVLNTEAHPFRRPKAGQALSDSSILD